MITGRYHAQPEHPSGYYGIWDCFRREWHVKPTLIPSEAFDMEERLNRGATR